MAFYAIFAATDFVELLRAGKKLTQDNRRPALREHLARHCHKAYLAESGFHVRTRNPLPTKLQVHFFN